MDDYWDKLSEGGQKQRCGWLKDKHGVTWQIIPSGLGKLLSDTNPRQSKKAVEAMLTMEKIDLEKITSAVDSDLGNPESSLQSAPGTLYLIGSLFNCRVSEARWGPVKPFVYVAAYACKSFMFSGSQRMTLL